MILPNETKIRFCNAYDAIAHHADTCQQCKEYLKGGDGDLCYSAKEIIAMHLCYADTDLNPTGMDVT